MTMMPTTLVTSDCEQGGGAKNGNDDITVITVDASAGV